MLPLRVSQALKPMRHFSAVLLRSLPSDLGHATIDEKFYA
jgi:hypothetical protein